MNLNFGSFSSMYTFPYNNTGYYNQQQASLFGNINNSIFADNSYASMFGSGSYNQTGSIFGSGQTGNSFFGMLQMLIKIMPMLSFFNSLIGSGDKKIDKKYDEDGNLISKIIDNKNGTKDVIWYNPDGSIKKTALRVENKDGTQTDYLKDADGNNIGTTTWDDDTVIRKDAKGNLISIKEPLLNDSNENIGRLETYYDNDGTIREIVHRTENEDGSKEFKTYSGSGELQRVITRVENEDGSYTDTMVDENGVSLGSTTISDDITIRKGADGNIDYKIENNDDGTQDITWYNEDGEITKTAHRVIEADGTKIDYMKNADGDDIGVTAYKQGKSARYDADGNIMHTSVNNTDGSKTVTWYDDDGNISQTARRVRDDDGNIVDYISNADGEELGYKKYDQNWKLLESTVES